MEDFERTSEEFWRAAINKLRGPLPEVGKEPPAIEKVEEAVVQKDLINGLDPETLGNFSKITMDVYFFMDQGTHKYFMMQAQTMTDYGEIELRKAVDMVKRKQKRNKG